MPILLQPNLGRRRKRKSPKPSVFQAVVLPSLSEKQGRFAGATWIRGSAVFLVLVMVTAILWSPRPKPLPEKNEIFVFEEESPPLPPPPVEPPPPPPDPEPLKPEPLPEEPPPPPQFGLQEEALSETGDLAVATGNTLQVAADSVISPAPPPLPPAPILMDQPPGILSGVTPEYPPRALDRGLEGTVIALITIDTAGKVTQVIVEKSAGIDFDNVVLASAQKTRFQPPMRHGRRVAAKFRRPYEFKLE